MAALVKGEFLGNRSVEMPILCATIPKYWEKEYCYEYLEEIDFNTDAGVIIIMGTSMDIIHGYKIADIFRQKNKTIVYGGYQDVFSLELMKGVVDAVYHGIPGPKANGNDPGGCVQTQAKAGIRLRGEY